MGMPDLARSWTREQVLELPDDGQRYLRAGHLLQPDVFVIPRREGRRRGLPRQTRRAPLS